jgi:hypothetical protein
MTDEASTVDLKLNKPQQHVFRWLFDENGQVIRRRTIFTAWGRGVGKSFFHRQIWWLLVANFDHKIRTEAPEPFHGVRITVICPTLKQFKDIHWAGVEEELRGPNAKWGFLGGKLNSSTGQIKFPGGSVLRAFPAQQATSKTARGMRTDVLDADEYDDIDADVYDSVSVPWLSEPWSLGIEIVGGTPTRGRHGIWWRTLQDGKLGQRLREGEIPPDELNPELCEDESDRKETQLRLDAIKSIYSLHATYRDAPEVVSPKAVAKAKATTLPATFAREWEADPDAGEGLVYPFNEEFHVITEADVPKYESFAEIHVGVDHGWVDPGVMLLCGVRGHGEDAELWVLEEHYESLVPNHIWNERALEWSFATFWCDPSRPDRIDELRNLGLTMGRSEAPINALLAGVSRVADMLFIREREDGTKWARLFVSSRCRNVIREFGLYRRKKLPDGTFGEDIEDKNNHSMDAARYVCFGRFGKVPNRRTTLG